MSVKRKLRRVKRAHTRIQRRIKRLGWERTPLQSYLTPRLIADVENAAAVFGCSESFIIAVAVAELFGRSHERYDDGK